MSGSHDRRRFLGLAAALGALALPGCAGPGRPSRDAAGSGTVDLKELVRLAREEGVLRLYGGGPTAIFTTWTKQFESAFPGIRVDIASGFSNELAARIDRQLAQGAPEADLAIFQTLQDFDRWKRQGELFAYRPEGFDRIADAFKDPAGTSIGIGINAVAYAYNPERVSTADAPKVATDFLKPQFSGQIISTYPHDDDITLYLYENIVRRHGWDYMDRLMANKPRFIRGHLGVSREIAAGRAGVSFDATVSQTLPMVRQGAKIVLTIPGEPMPIFYQGAAVLRRAAHPNAAKLYLAWFLQKEQQSRLGPGRWSPRSDVPAPQGLRPILEYNVLAGFREFVLDEPRLQDLRRRFESYIGPVKGESVL